MIVCECVCMCECVCAYVCWDGSENGGVVGSKNATLSNPEDVLSGDPKARYTTDNKKIQGNLHGLRHIKAIGCHGFQSINPKLLSNFGVKSISFIYKHYINILFD